MICPSCEHEHIVKPSATANMTVSTFSFAQKIFPFLGYAVGTYGRGQVTNKTVYFAARQLESELRAKDWQPANIDEVGEVLSNATWELLKQDLGEMEDKEDDWKTLGLQVVGYEDSEPVTLEIDIGKNISVQKHSEIGMTVSGQNEIAVTMWKLTQDFYQSEPALPLFSLQDAIDYAEFLIATTAGVQRFSNTQAGVGGEIDIAFVTPFDGFKWIKQKALGRIIGGTND